MSAFPYVSYEYIYAVSSLAGLPYLRLLTQNELGFSNYN